MHTASCECFYNGMLRLPFAHRGAAEPASNRPGTPRAGGFEKSPQPRLDGRGVCAALRAQMGCPRLIGGGFDGAPGLTDPQLKLNGLADVFLTDRWLLGSPVGLRRLQRDVCDGAGM